MMYSVITVLRALALREGSEKIWKEYTKFDSHLAERMPTPIYSKVNKVFSKYSPSIPQVFPKYSPHIHQVFLKYSYILKMLKISAFYLDKQKSFVSIKK